MAQSNYEGEIKQSMAEKPKSKPPKGKPTSRSSGPPGNAAVPSRPPSGASNARPSQPPVAAVAEEPMQQGGMNSPSFGSGGSGDRSPAHAAMAASIAHAILQKGGQ